MTRRPELFPFFTVAALLTVADQLTKLAVVSNLAFNESRTLIPGLLSLTHYRNPGGAFSLLAWLPPLWSRSFFIAATFGALVFVYYLYHSDAPVTRLGRVALVLIAGGGLGNLIDRLVYGEVIDFVLLYYGDYYWPAFNVADSCISVGVAILLVDFIRSPYGDPPYGDPLPGEAPGGDVPGERGGE